MASDGKPKEQLKLGGVKIVVERMGKGPPLLLLQSAETYEADHPLIARLAEKNEVILPWAPGFGASPLPDTIRSVDDIAYVYLDLLEALDLKNVVLLGCSLGGWIAAEMATKTCERLSSIILSCALGVKFGGAYDRDIADIYFHPFDKVRAFKFADPEADPLYDMTKLSKRASMRVAQHRETTARLCWEPYFHNPALKNRLHRISVPTTVIWGAKDGFVTLKYGRAYARRIPDARFVSIPRAGHYPQIEQTETFLGEIADHLGGRKRR